MPNVALVALDISVNHPKFKDEYNKLTADKKIDYIAEQIETICADLATKEKDAEWIISWREYAITDPDSKFISNEHRAYFKEVMEKLSAKYPQLTILSGAMATKKEFKDLQDDSKIKIIQSYYENQFTKTHAGKQVDLHKKAVEDLLSNPTNLKHMQVVRNTSYTFKNGKCDTRHDKLAPYWETSSPKEWYNLGEDENKKTQLPNVIFQPGHKDDKGINTNIYHLKTIDGKLIPIGFEICLEHALGALLYELTQTSMSDPLFLQIVSAAGMVPRLNHICGEYYVLLDYDNKPQLLLRHPVSDADLDKVPVHLYEFDCFKHSSAKMSGPLKPIYPDALDALTKFKNIKSYIKDVLEDEQKTYLDFVDTCINDIVDLPEGKIKIEDVLQKMLQKTFEFKTGLASSPSQNIEILVESLFDAINTLALTRTNLTPKETVPLLQRKPTDVNVNDQLRTTLTERMNEFLKTLNSIKTATLTATNITFFTIQKQNPQLVDAKIAMTKSLLALIKTTQSTDEMHAIFTDYITIDKRVDKVYNTSGAAADTLNLSNSLMQMKAAIMNSKIPRRNFPVKKKS